MSTPGALPPSTSRIDIRLVEHVAVYGLGPAALRAQYLRVDLELIDDGRRAVTAVVPVDQVDPGGP